MKVVILGTGNVAFHFGKILKKTGNEIVQVFGRNKITGRKLSKELKCQFTDSISDLISDADIYIFALKDDIFSKIIKQIKFTPSLIVHTSGTVDLKLFPKHMKNAGVIYPVQSIRRDNKINFNKVLFCIEATNRSSLLKIRKIILPVSKHIILLNSKKRQLIHLAAVFANNFSNHLFTIAFEMLRKEKLSHSIINSLIKETFVHALSGTSANAQTGPAKRGDKKVMDHHKKLLSDQPELINIYKSISKSIGKNYGK